MDHTPERGESEATGSPRGVRSAPPRHEQVPANASVEPGTTWRQASATHDCRTGHSQSPQGEWMAHSPHAGPRYFRTGDATPYSGAGLSMRKWSNHFLMCCWFCTRRDGMPERDSSWFSPGKRTMTTGFFW